MALFLVTNNLTADDVLDSKRELAFPESVVDLVSGRMGQPPGGFPAKIRQRVLRGEKPLRGRPGASLPAGRFQAGRRPSWKAKLGRKPKRREVLSYLMFPKVTSEFVAHQKKFSDTSVLPTPLFFYGQQPGEEVTRRNRAGQDADHQVPGRRRSASRRPADRLLRTQRPAAQRSTSKTSAATATGETRPKADRGDTAQVGAPMPGMVVTVVGQRGRYGGRGPEAVYAGGHEDGNDDLRRAGRARRRSACPAGHAGRLRRIAAATGIIGRSRRAQPRLEVARGRLRLAPHLDCTPAGSYDSSGSCANEARVAACQVFRQFVVVDPAALRPRRKIHDSSASNPGCR